MGQVATLVFHRGEDAFSSIRYRAASQSGGAVVSICMLKSDAQGGATTSKDISHYETDLVAQFSPIASASLY